MSNRLLEWIVGKAPSKLYRVTVTFLISFLFVCYLIAGILHEGDFSILTYEISALGNRISNPIGQHFFNGGMIVSGIILIPHLLKLSRQFKIENKFVKSIQVISSLFLVIGGIGVSGVGIFPSYIYILHVISAIAAIGGLFLGSFFMIIPLIYLFKHDSKWPSKVFTTLSYGSLYATCLFTLIYTGIPVFQQFLASEPINPPEIWPLSEWLILANNIFWLGVLIYSPNYE